MNTYHYVKYLCHIKQVYSNCLPYNLLSDKPIMITDRDSASDSTASVSQPDASSTARKLLSVSMCFIPFHAVAFPEVNVLILTVLWGTRERVMGRS